MERLLALHFGGGNRPAIGRLGQYRFAVGIEKRDRATDQVYADLKPGGGEDGLAIFGLQRPVGFDEALRFRDHALVVEERTVLRTRDTYHVVGINLYFQEGVIDGNNDAVRDFLRRVRGRAG